MVYNANLTPRTDLVEHWHGSSSRPSLWESVAVPLLIVILPPSQKQIDHFFGTKEV